MAKKITNKEVDDLSRTLRPEHRAFVEHYLAGHSPAQAYRLAGLGGDTNSDVRTDTRPAEALLNAPRIRLYIDALQRCSASRSILTLDAIDQRLSDMALADLVDVLEIGENYVDDNGVWHTDIRLRSADELTVGQRAAIVSIKGNDGGLEIKMADKMKALDMLVKRRGGYKEVTEVNHTGNVQVIAMVGSNGRGPAPKITEREEEDTE